MFPLPIAIAPVRDKYRQDPFYNNLFEGNSLKIQIFPAGTYVPMFEGTETGYKDGFNTAFVEVGIKRYGFEIRIQDGRQAIYRILEALIANAYNGCSTVKTIECWDFIEDEEEATGYKIRQGHIADLKKRGGVVCRQKFGKQRKLTQGLTFQFLEKDRRFVGR